MSVIWGARTLALDIVVAVVGTAMREKKNKTRNKEKLNKTIKDRGQSSGGLGHVYVRGNIIHTKHR